MPYSLRAESAWYYCTMYLSYSTTDDACLSWEDVSHQAVNPIGQRETSGESSWHVAAVPEAKHKFPALCLFAALQVNGTGLRAPK